MSYEWLECNLKAFPRFLCFVAEIDKDIIGYIIWAQKSGFRPEVVLELEQIAVSTSRRGQGIGRNLIEESLPLVREQLAKRGATLKHIIRPGRIIARKGFIKKQSVQRLKRQYQTFTLPMKC